jgi:outer membrane protein insertion porin family
MLSAPAFAQQGAGGADAPLTGPCATPDSVVFRGNQRISDAMLRGDAGITPGMQLNARILQRAIKNLYATAQFEDIAIVCEPNGAGPAKSLVAFVVKERPVLGDIRVTGPMRLSAGSVRDRIDLLVSRPIDPASVARSVARIDSLYEANGYYLARVTVDTEVVAGQTTLTFRVNEGRRTAVSGISVEGNHALSDKAIVKGMQTRPEGFLWWKKGEFDEDKFAGDITERIPQLYGNKGFIDMQVQKDTLIVDRERGKAQVDLAVNEGPQYRVGDFEVSGAKILSSQQLHLFYPFGDRQKSLTEAVKDVFRIGGGDGDGDIFDKGKWEEATRSVQNAYANEGYIYATVNPIIERRRVGKDSVPTVNLRWEIDERSPAIVNRVEIFGNDITSEGCIRDQILVVPGDVFRQDLLVRSYQSIANLGFFETPLPVPETRQTENGTDVDIVFHVKEKRTGNVNFGASVGQGVGVGGFIGFEQPNLFGMCKRGSLQWQFGRYINDFNLAYTDPRIRESQISGTVNAYRSESRFAKLLAS